LEVFTDDAEACKRRMNAASALIGGLGGEKERWTEQSKMFQAQLTKYVMYTVHTHCGTSRHVI